MVVDAIGSLGEKNRLDVIGIKKVIKERQVGNEHFNIYTACLSSETTVTILRGSSE